MRKDQDEFKENVMVAMGVGVNSQTNEITDLLYKLKKQMVRKCINLF